jgi:hypothetical protein
MSLIPDIQSLQGIFAGIKNKLNIAVYISYHDDASFIEAQQLLESIQAANEIEIIKLVLLKPSKYFENQIFQHLKKFHDEWKNVEYVCILTYAMQKKMKKLVDLRAAVQHARNSNVDVIGLYNIHFKKNETYLPMIEGAVFQHGLGFYLAWHDLLSELGYNDKQIIDPNLPGFFCNWWLANPKWMQRYIDFFDRCVDIIENDKKIKTLFDASAYYNGTLGADVLIRMTGFDYYTVLPFVFERLPSIFFHHSGANVSQKSSNFTYRF